MTPEPLLHRREVAKLLSVSVSWVQNHSVGTTEPRLAMVKLGKACRYRREDVDAFVEECRQVVERRG